MEFIEKAKQAALSALTSGLFPSVAIAQAALETGFGKSELSAKYNNYFGIKNSPGWKGKVVNMKTGEVLNGKNVTVTAGFRVYDSFADSIADRNNFLKVNPRYTNAGVFSAETPEAQAKALLKAGYATDPEYANKLIKLINQYNLKEVDGEAKKKVPTVCNCPNCGVRFNLVVS